MPLERICINSNYNERIYSDSKGHPAKESDPAFHIQATTTGSTHEVRVTDNPT